MKSRQQIEREYDRNEDNVNMISIIVGIILGITYTVLATACFENDTIIPSWKCWGAYVTVDTRYLNQFWFSITLQFLYSSMLLAYLFRLIVGTIILYGLQDDTSDRMFMHCLTGYGDPWDFAILILFGGFLVSLVIAFIISIMGKVILFIVVAAMLGISILVLSKWLIDRSAKSWRDGEGNI